MSKKRKSQFSVDQDQKEENGQYSEETSVNGVLDTSKQTTELTINETSSLIGRIHSEYKNVKPFFLKIN